MVPDVREIASARVRVGRHVRFGAVDFFGPREAIVDIREAARDVATLIRHYHQTRSVRRAHCGAVRIAHLDLAADGVVRELR